MFIYLFLYCSTVLPRFFEHTVFRIPRFFELFPWSCRYSSHELPFIYQTLSFSNYFVTPFRVRNIEVQLYLQNIYLFLKKNISLNIYCLHYLLYKDMLLLYMAIIYYFEHMYLFIYLSFPLFVLIFIFFMSSPPLITLWWRELYLCL